MKTLLMTLHIKIIIKLIIKLMTHISSASRSFYGYQSIIMKKLNIHIFYVEWVKIKLFIKTI